MDTRLNFLNHSSRVRRRIFMIAIEGGLSRGEVPSLPCGCAVRGIQAIENSGKGVRNVNAGQPRFFFPADVGRDVALGSRSAVTVKINVRGELAAWLDRVVIQLMAIG